MKKSGLADSPFFAPTPPPGGAAPPDIGAPQPLFERAQAATHEGTSEQTHEDTDAQTHIRAVEPMHEGTDAQMHERTLELTNTRSDAHAHNRALERTHERTDEQPPRTISRYSFDLYDDQADAIEALRLSWHKARGRYLTKGEVMRELLEEVLKMHD